MKRVINERRYNKTIFILCQGKVTEPQYFNYFSQHNKIKSLKIKVASQNETDPLKLVNWTIKNYKEEINTYDEFWLVYDKDESSETSFNNAYIRAKNNKIKIAYSNQAFELWFIHHFKKFHIALNRKKYKEELNRLLDFDYGKDQNTAKKVAETLYPLFDQAIVNSEASYNNFEHNNLATEESSTTVFQLAKSIKEFKI